MKLQRVLQRFRSLRVTIQAVIIQTHIAVNLSESRVELEKMLVMSQGCGILTLLFRCSRFLKLLDNGCLAAVLGAEI